MFSEPLIAHPAEIGGVPAAWHSHRRDNDDRNPRDDEAENEQHMVALFQVFCRRTTILAPL